MELTRKHVKSEWAIEILDGENKGLVIYETAIMNKPSQFRSFNKPNDYFGSVKEVLDNLDK
ncbi:MAG: hypothetical protein COA36_16795 [Desulfotalea sp.]|nr:MAG: hypothetical protein COA36_16795 [Desulfotalea sp.]